MPKSSPPPAPTRAWSRLTWVWGTLLACLLAQAPPALGDPIALPDIGASAGGALTPAQEEAIGREFMHELRNRVTIVADPEVREYIQALGFRLAAHSDDPGHAYTFFVVQDPAINAFAAPGGYVGVNSGLILAAESESELAAVLAHEIAHVTQHHIARGFEATSHLTGASIAALVAAILIGTQNPDAGMATAAAAQAGAIQYQIDFTRQNEKEADRVGIATLAQADFDPRSMAGFFERLQTATRYYGRPPEFLSTHPVTVSRIADARGRADQYRYRQYTDSETFRMVRAKLRVITARDPAKAVSYFADALKSGRYASEDAARYGHALALARSARYGEALSELARLRKARPERVPLLMEQARIELLAHRDDQALALYRTGLELFPDNEGLVRGYAEALLRLRRAGEARTLLQDHVREHTPTPPVYRQLARAEQASGHPTEARLAMAEYYYGTGETHAAIDQLERAQKEGGDDYYLAARVAARLKQLKEEARAAKDR